MSKISALIPLFVAFCANCPGQTLPCSSTSDVNVALVGSGGSVSTAIAAEPGCDWIAFTLETWITLLPSGPNYGGLSYIVAANTLELAPSLILPNNSPRSGYVFRHFVGQPTLPDQIFTINQTGIDCAYSLGATGGAIAPAGGGGSFTVQSTSSLCPFQIPNPSNPFIKIVSSNWVNGSGSVAYSVTANNTGLARTGTLEIAGQMFMISQQSLPSPVALDSVSGSGATHPFVFTFSDPNGWQDLGVLNALINRALDGRNACYLAYDRPSNVLYLVGDIGGGLTGFLLNGSGSISNSQCTVNGVGSSALGSGNTLTLTIALTFNQTTFAGEKITYLAARDIAQNNSGWRTMGVWGVPRLTPVFPSIQSATPSEGGGATQQFSVTYRDTSSSANLRTMQLLINSDLNANLACYMGYDHASNQLYLVNDTNSGLLLPGIAPNSGTGAIENNQCAINGAATTKNESGTDLTLTISLTFKPGFAGPKVVFTGVQTISNANSDWHALGFWNVPGS